MIRVENVLTTHFPVEMEFLSRRTEKNSRARETICGSISSDLQGFRLVYRAFLYILESHIGWIWRVSGEIMPEVREVLYTEKSSSIISVFARYYGLSGL